MASPSPATSCEAPSAKHKVDKGEAASGERSPEEYVRTTHHPWKCLLLVRTVEGALPISGFRERSDRPRPRGQGARPGERTGEAKKRRRPNKHGASALTLALRTHEREREWKNITPCLHFGHKILRSVCKAPPPHLRFPHTHELAKKTEKRWGLPREAYSKRPRPILALKPPTAGRTASTSENWAWS
jgi:hypothetical protein